MVKEFRDELRGISLHEEELESLLDMMPNPFEVERVIFNDPATIVLWEDGTKTVVQARGGDKYDKMVGLALCFAKKACGNTGYFNEVFKEYIPGYGAENKTPVTVEAVGTLRKLTDEEAAEALGQFGLRKKVDKGKLMALHKAGWSADAIADEMGIHISTVYKYLKGAE